jgi:hypothetical protein
LDGIRVRRLGGRGRPRTRPDRLIADKGYSYPRCRRLLRARQIPHTIPERSDQRARRAARPGRPLAFDRTVYARRNVVEIVCTQMTKTDVLAGWRRGDDVADFDIAVRDDHLINQQLDEEALLLEGGLSEPSLYPLTQSLY